MTASATHLSTHLGACARSPADYIVTEDASLKLTDCLWIWHRACAATEDVAADLRSQGLIPLAPDRATRETFRSAATYLTAVPDLEAELVRQILRVTPLRADIGYDISHSEPRWPTAIFVSVPSATDHNPAIRLLENIVHEGMHLRLTNLERLHPLVRPGAGRLFSPWKRQDRDTQGVLHGLYVFVCIAMLFKEPQLLACLDSKDRRYATRRISEIKVELEDVKLSLLEHGLTDRGRWFLQALLTLTNQDNPWTL